jgi:hypothetical protein
VQLPVIRKNEMARKTKKNNFVQKENQKSRSCQLLLMSKILSQKKRKRKK